MAKENKKCLYLTTESIGIIADVLKDIKKKTISNAVNLIIKEYAKIRRFIIKDDNYRTVKISIRKELLPLLSDVENKSDTKAVCDLISIRLLEEFKRQADTFRKRFPDRLYNTDKYLNDLSSKVFEEYKKKFF